MTTNNLGVSFLPIILNGNMESQAINTKYFLLNGTPITTDGGSQTIDLSNFIGNSTSFSGNVSVGGNLHASGNLTLGDPLVSISFDPVVGVGICPIFVANTLEAGQVLTYLINANAINTNFLNSNIIYCNFLNSYQNDININSNLLFNNPIYFNGNSIYEIGVNGNNLLFSLNANQEIDFSNILALNNNQSNFLNPLLLSNISTFNNSAYFNGLSSYSGALQINQYTPPNTTNKIYFDGSNLNWNGKALLQNGSPITGYVPIIQPTTYLNESQYYQAIFTRYFDFSGSNNLNYYNYFPYNQYSDLPDWITLANVNNTGLSLSLGNGIRTVGQIDGHRTYFYNPGFYPINVYYSNASLPASNIMEWSGIIQQYFTVNRFEIVSVIYIASLGYYYILNRSGWANMSNAVLSNLTTTSINIQGNTLTNNLTATNNINSNTLNSNFITTSNILTPYANIHTLQVDTLTANSLVDLSNAVFNVLSAETITAPGGYISSGYNVVSNTSTLNTVNANFITSSNINANNINISSGNFSISNLSTNQIINTGLINSNSMITPNLNISQLNSISSNININNPLNFSGYSLGLNGNNFLFSGNVFNFGNSQSITTANIINIVPTIFQSNIEILQGIILDNFLPNNNFNSLYNYNGLYWGNTRLDINSNTNLNINNLTAINGNITNINSSNINGNLNATTANINNATISNLIISTKATIPSLTATNGTINSLSGTSASFVSSCSSPFFYGQLITQYIQYSIFTTPGIIHNNNLGVFSSSLIVDNDVSANAYINPSKIAFSGNTIPTANIINLSGSNINIIGNLSANNANLTNNLNTSNLTVANQTNLFNATISGALTMNIFNTLGVVHSYANGILYNAMIVDADISSLASINPSKINFSGYNGTLTFNSGSNSTNMIIQGTTATNAVLTEYYNSHDNNYGFCGLMGNYMIGTAYSGCMGLVSYPNSKPIVFSINGAVPIVSISTTGLTCLGNLTAINSISGSSLSDSTCTITGGYATNLNHKGTVSFYPSSGLTQYLQINPGSTTYLYSGASGFSIDGQSLGYNLNLQNYASINFYSSSVLIGYLSKQNASDTFEVNGKIGSTSTTITNLSDQQVKENIENIDVNICLDAINKLQIKTFNFTEDYHKHYRKDERKYIGLIAQDVEVVDLFSNCVSTNINPVQFYDTRQYDIDCAKVVAQNNLNGNTDLKTPDLNDYKTVQKENLKHLNIDDILYSALGAIQALSQQVKILQSEIAILKVNNITS